jgi:cell filamentation protein
VAGDFMKENIEDDLYENRHSIYCYPNTDILINKLDLKDNTLLQKYEAKITAAKLLALRQKGIIGTFNSQHIKDIHKYLFEDIYPFAGIFRTENIGKGVFRFAEWQFIESELDKLLDILKNENYLENYSQDITAKRLAYYISELNVLHPFREGNGRTIREFIRELALKNKYILNLKKVDPKDFFNASVKSIADTNDLEKLINICLEKQ